MIEGRGHLRLGGAERSVDAGSFVACPVGEAGAHQLANDSDEPLRYLCVSQMVEPEVVVQPDSGKVGVIAGTPPGGEPAGRTLTAFFRRADALDPSREEL